MQKISLFSVDKGVLSGAIVLIHLNVSKIIQRIKGEKQNEQPTTDCFGRVFIILTSFGHTMTFLNPEHGFYVCYSHF